MAPACKKCESRSGKKRTLAVLQQLQELIEEDPIKSLRHLARERDVSPFLIKQGVRKYSRFKSNVLPVRQLFTDRMKLCSGRVLAAELHRLQPP